MTHGEFHKNDDPPPEWLQKILDYADGTMPDGYKIIIITINQKQDGQSLNIMGKGMSFLELANTICPLGQAYAEALRKLTE